VCGVWCGDGWIQNERQYSFEKLEGTAYPVPKERALKYPSEKLCGEVGCLRALARKQ